MFCVVFQFVLRGVRTLPHGNIVVVVVVGVGVGVGVVGVVVGLNIGLFKEIRQQ